MESSSLTFLIMPLQHAGDDHPHLPPAGRAAGRVHRHSPESDGAHVPGGTEALPPAVLRRLHDRVQVDHLVLDAGHVWLDVLVEPRLELSPALPDLADGEPPGLGYATCIMKPGCFLTRSANCVDT